MAEDVEPEAKVNTEADTDKSKSTLHLLPRVLAQLIGLELLFTTLVDIQGGCFLELFSGASLLTLALLADTHTGRVCSASWRQALCHSWRQRSANLASRHRTPSPSAAS